MSDLDLFNSIENMRLELSILRKENEDLKNTTTVDTYEGYHCIDDYTKGYEQGQKDFDTKVTKLLNSYGVTFIDTNSIGGLIALHQLMLDLEKENEELKERLQIESQSLHEQCEIVCKQVEHIKKMKCCENCNKNRKAKCDDNLRVLAKINRICDKWELAE